MCLSIKGQSYGIATNYQTFLFNSEELKDKKYKTVLNLMFNFEQLAFYSFIIYMIKCILKDLLVELGTCH